MLLLSLLLQLCLITVRVSEESSNSNDNNIINLIQHIIVIKAQQQQQQHQHQQHQEPQLTTAIVDAAVFIIVVVAVAVLALLATFNSTKKQNNNDHKIIQHSNNKNNNNNRFKNNINRIIANIFIWTRKRRKVQRKIAIESEINAKTTTTITATASTSTITTLATTTNTITTTNIITSCWMPSSPATNNKLKHQQHRQQQQQQQQHQQQHRKRPRLIISKFSGFPLALSSLLAALSILNFTATLQTMAFTTSTATAVGYTEVQQQQQQQQQQQYQPTQPQQLEQLEQQEHQEHQHQSNLLAVIENSLDSSNHTFKSFSHINADAFASAETEVMPVETQPIFDFGLPRNITARTGQAEAVIKCRVGHLNDKSVSWIRKRDLHILTVATSTYTSDKRFQVTASKDQREWTLHVKSPQSRDSGIYECQVNTEPKMSMAFQLNIIVTPPDARAVISGPADLHFKVGSVIILNCIVEQPSFKDIGPIYWYRGEQMLMPFRSELDEIDVDAKSGSAGAAAVAGLGAAAGGAAAATASADDVPLNAEQGITNDIENDFAARIAMESQLGDTLKSRLRISNAQTTDTGNYSCQPTTASSASVMIHVINDENPAAMQKSEATSLFAATFAAKDAPLLLLRNVAAPWLLNWLLTLGGIDRLVIVFYALLREAIYFLFTSSIISR